MTFASRSGRCGWVWGGLLVLVLGACNGDGGPADAALDQSVPRDLAIAPDLTGPVDLTAVDLTVVEQGVVDLRSPDLDDFACSNRVRDGLETDVDCGGGICPACGVDQACQRDADCQTGACDPTARRCVVPVANCNNGVRDGFETDVDCGGGVCPLCGVGQFCQGRGDCVSGLCDPVTRRCVPAPASCSNGVRDGTETDVDCGGGCPACNVNAVCLVREDCRSGICEGQPLRCGLAATCSNGSRDGTETDVDCGGGGCRLCAVSQGCRNNGDCQSGICNGQTLLCMAGAACTNGVRDGTETDVDCGGGGCAGCGLGQGCQRAGDCRSGVCDGQRLVCLSAANCSNGLRDGAETDVDCGGGECPVCNVGQGCQRGGDCVSGSCNALRCVPAPASCANGVRDGTETDVDCGGGGCPACAAGARCQSNGDCQSGICDGQTLLCALAASCTNGVRDGAETDVDCGGGGCRACDGGAGCRNNTDCQSGICNGQTLRCAFPPPSCTNGRRDGTETDVDCGGGACPACSAGQACAQDRDCQLGFCDPVNRLCRTPECFDRYLNGLETDVDCGGSCAPCFDGQRCRVGTDCTSGSCNAGLCAAPSCTDGVRNGAETDVDCGGGVCPRCAEGRRCGGSSDCQSGNCSGGVCASAPSCADGVRNGNETDVDCGGACPPCSDGRRCAVDADCAGRSCNPATGLCATPSCADGVRNGSETAVDCGGGVCPRCRDGQPCSVNSDCASGSCNGGVCRTSPPYCSNGLRDVDETDVDCGGLRCPGCASGQRCTVRSDCQSGSCMGGVCAPASCGDAVRNGAETDVDCGGGTCPACADGRVCNGDADCQSGYCNPAVRLCASPNCADGVRNGTETGVDCGGPACPGCPNGMGCAVNSDCASGSCVGGVCRTVGPGCSDGLRNGSETDVDCGGGACLACANGRSCIVSSDCQSALCSGGVCAGPSCTDGLRNGTETDVDCGGACPPCASGQGCNVSNDCASGYCNPAARVCASPNCADGLRNGTETGVDCGGGVCSRCPEGQPCNVNNDCASGSCTGGVCRMVPPYCSNGLRDADETDVDCGGLRCAGCASGQRCNVRSDCQSGSCVGGVCAPASCVDAVRNGAETDVDCGGGICPACADGRVCNGDADCQSGSCNLAVRLCASPNCADGIRNGTETGVDCGGPVCPACSNGQPCDVNSDCVSGSCSGGVCMP